MGVARASLYRVFDGKAPISAELALRFTRLTGGSPDLYLEMQNNFDLQWAQTQLTDELARIQPL